jgi:drug/metabolite transporter (DMT)-like permease
MTALIAWFVFRENVDRRIALDMTAIAAGAVVQSWPGETHFAGTLPALAILGACLAWAKSSVGLHESPIDVKSHAIVHELFLIPALVADDPAAILGDKTDVAMRMSVTPGIDTMLGHQPRQVRHEVR